MYSDVRAGTVNKKNLEHIIEELSGRLDHDDIAKNLLTEEFSSRFIKSHKSWDIKTQFENVQYIGRKLSNKTYYNHIVESLKHLINLQVQKLIRSCGIMFVLYLIHYKIAKKLNP